MPGGAPVRRRELLKLAALGTAGLALPASGQTPPAASDPQERAFRARERWWARVGRNDPDLISYLVNPEFSGSPPWPATRQAFRVVRTARSLIIASDGLSDPFPDAAQNEGASGFGMEVYLEAPELREANFATLRDSWAFGLIENFARNVANWGGIAAPLRSQGILSTELPAPQGMDPAWLTPRGTVGALVNVPAPGRATEIADMPYGPALVAAVTLITPAETAYVVAGGADARRALARRLAEAGTHQLSHRSRRSLVPAGS